MRKNETHGRACKCLTTLHIGISWMLDLEPVIEELKETIHLKLVQPDTVHYALVLRTRRPVPLVYGVSENMTYYNMTTRHAEMDALQKIQHKRNLPHTVDVLVVRLSKTGTRGQARPCLHCVQRMHAVTNTRIRNIYYSNEHGTIVQEKMDAFASTFVCSGMRRHAKQHNNYPKMKKEPPRARAL